MEPQPRPPSIKVDIAPYGTLEVYAPEPLHDELLLLERNWAELWPPARSKLEERSTRLGIRKRLEHPNWLAAIQRIEPGVFMADKAKLLLSISTGNSWPQWDFYVTGIRIVHFQPVY